MRLINLVGNRYGKLVVTEEVKSKNRHGQRFWLCVCDCGSSKEILGYNLRHGHSNSCGCGQYEAIKRNMLKGRLPEHNDRRKRAKLQYGPDYIDTKDPWFRTAAGRAHIAKTKGIPFGFPSVHAFATHCKAIAPAVCPILGIALTQRGTNKFNSPSIDRIDPTLGYVPGNIQIISFKANAMKHNATADELKAFAKWINQHIS